MEMGIVRDLFKYAGYLVVFPVIQSKSFSDRVLIPEIFFCGFPAQDKGIWLFECCLGISFEKRDGEDIEKRGICKDNPIFLVGIIPVLNDIASLVTKADNLFDFRVGIEDDFGHGRMCGANVKVPASPMASKCDPVYPVGIFVVIIVAQLMIHIEKDQKTGGHSDGQPGNVDQRITLVFNKIS